MRITDNQGNRISMSHTTWVEYCSNIEQLVQSTLEAITIAAQAAGNSSSVIIEIVKIRNENVVKFTLHDTSIYVKPSTVRFMPDILEHYVKSALRSKWQNVFKVDEKFKEFVTIIRQNCINNKCDALKKIV